MKQGWSRSGNNTTLKPSQEERLYQPISCSDLAMTRFNFQVEKRSFYANDSQSFKFGTNVQLDSNMNYFEFKDELRSRSL